jgi:hypothetical protein
MTSLMYDFNITQLIIFLKQYVLNKILVRTNYIYIKFNKHNNKNNKYYVKCKCINIIYYKYKKLLYLYKKKNFYINHL